MTGPTPADPPDAGYEGSCALSIRTKRPVLEIPSLDGLNTGMQRLALRDRPARSLMASTQTFH